MLNCNMHITMALLTYSLFFCVFALEAWLKSPASQQGTFLIAGEFLPAYQKKLAPMLSHPSVKMLGHRNDIPELMRQSDSWLLSSIEEGSALAASEARGSGCVLLVSDAAGAICQHGENALVHPVSDVETLAQHITSLHQDRVLWPQLRAASLSTIKEITWTAAGVKLLQAYRETLTARQRVKNKSLAFTESRVALADLL